MVVKLRKRICEQAAGVDRTFSHCESFPVRQFDGSSRIGAKRGAGKRAGMRMDYSTWKAKMEARFSLRPVSSGRLRKGTLRFYEPEFVQAFLGAMEGD